jgi:uncharacterized membrane protein YphA (DoxX/SURF4 family)
MVIQAGKKKVGLLKNKLKKMFNNNWIEFGIRLIIGLTFIYASYHKIGSPSEFAKTLYGYDLVPGILINLIAITLPCFEMVSGVARITGIYPRSASLIINSMLVIFIIVLSVNLIRGHEFDCGCFSPDQIGYTASAGLELGRDIILLGMGLQVFLYRMPRKWCVHSGEKTDLY